MYARAQACDHRRREQLRRGSSSAVPLFAPASWPSLEPGPYSSPCQALLPRRTFMGFVSEARTCTETRAPRGARDGIKCGRSSAAAAAGAVALRSQYAVSLTTCQSLLEIAHPVLRSVSSCRVFCTVERRTFQVSGVKVHRSVRRGGGVIF